MTFMSSLDSIFDKSAPPNKPFDCVPHPLTKPLKIIKAFVIYTFTSESRHIKNVKWTFTLLNTGYIKVLTW